MVYDLHPPSLQSNEAIFMRFLAFLPRNPFIEAPEERVHI